MVWGEVLLTKDRLAVDEIISIEKQDKIKLADLIFKVIESKPFQFSQ